MPYIPKITVKTRPTAVVAAISPKPIVVTTAKQYHKASGKLVMPSSIVTKIKEKHTIMVNKPNKTSKEKVETTILIKTWNLNWEKIMAIASIKDITAIKTHSNRMVL